MKSRSRIKGKISDKDLEWVKNHTGDKSMTKNRLKSDKWYLPTSLTVDVNEYFKKRSKIKKDK